MARTNEVVITYETLFELYRREKNRDELQKLEPDFFERAVAYMKDLRKTLPEMTDDVLDRNRSLVLNIKKLLKDIYARRERKLMNMALIKTVSPQSIIELSTLLEHEKLLFDSLCDVLKLKRMQVLSHLENNEYAFSLNSSLSSINSLAASTVFSPSLSTSSSFSSSIPSDAPLASSPSVSPSAPPARDLVGSSSADEDQDLRKIRLQFRENQPKFIGPNLEIYGPYTSGDTAELPKIIADIILESGKAISVE